MWTSVSPWAAVVAAAGKGLALVADDVMAMDVADDDDGDVNAPGTAVQVDPITPLLKAPGTNLSKLKHIQFLSIFAFNFNLRRCSPSPSPSPLCWTPCARTPPCRPWWAGST
jgi:hypothetical protein